jgi:hypothetical protein
MASHIARARTRRDLRDAPPQETNNERQVVTE